MLIAFPIDLTAGHPCLQRGQGKDVGLILCTGKALHGPTVLSSSLELSSLTFLKFVVGRIMALKGVFVPVSRTYECGQVKEH
jgi:hypothetical protein